MIEGFIVVIGSHNIIMVSILRATEEDYNSIVDIGKISVAEAHRDSCSTELLNAFVGRNYNKDAIKKELADSNNVYHIIYYGDKAVGFSKIIFNTGHPNIARANVAKLDRIYLFKEFQGFKLGFALLQFNIELSKKNHQSGIWLYTWTGNRKAIDKKST